MPPPFVSGTFSLRHGGLGFTEATYNAANQSASLHCWIARNQEDRATIENHPFDSDIVVFTILSLRYSRDAKRSNL